MKMVRSSPSRRNQFRKLTLEGLQDRRLMAADVSIPLATMVELASSQAAVGSLNANTQPGVGTELKITHFQTEADAITALTQRAVEQWSSQFGQPAYPWMAEDFASANFANIANPDNVLYASFDRVSSGADGAGVTNVQTSNVDEGDNLEMSTDGYAFVFRDQVVRIIDVRNPSELKEVARIDTGYAGLLHLIGNQLIVISQGLGSTLGSPAAISSSRFGMIPFESRVAPLQTNVTIYDVTAKNAPIETAAFRMEGTVAASRIVNNKLVLVQNAIPGIPQLQMVSPTNPIVEGADSLWLARYETKDEYLARIQPIILDYVLVNYETLDKDGKTISQGVVGDWRDIALADGNEVTSVITIDVASDAPKLGTSETILGGWIGNILVTESSIYLTSNVDENETQIVHINFADSEGQMTADAVGNVRGIIRNARFMDEFEGKLRVVTTEDGSNSGGRIRNSANLFVMQVDDGELKAVGELLDISPGDQAYAAEFDGPRAVITTGFINPVTMIRPFDPLHGIDLSDPTHPKELSDLVIPGITNYVHWVDTDHLIGVGMFEENSLWYAQVSLYDVSNLAAPKTLDSWHGTVPIQPNLFSSPNALDIHFNPTSKTLTIPQAEGRAFPLNRLWSPANIDLISWNPDSLLGQSASVAVLSIDLDVDDPVALLAEVGDGSGMGRAVVVGDTLIALSNVSMTTYSLEKPTQILDRILVANPLQSDWVYHTDDSPKTLIDVLVNDSLSSEYTITAIKGSQLRGTVRILPNQRLEYTNPADLKSDELAWWDSFSYEVTTKDGAKFETMVSVNGQRRTVINEQTTAVISLKALDAEGWPVTSTAKGDEFWVEVQVQAGNNAKGVYSAYVDLAFDTNSFEIVGDAEPLGDFTNGLSGEKTTEGWKNLGGFSDSVTPPGSIVQSVVRFKLRAIEDASLHIVGSTSTRPGSEMTVYGVDRPVLVANITSSPLQLPLTVGKRWDPSWPILVVMRLNALDSENNPVTTTAKGDEFWVEMQMEIISPNGPTGVDSAYVDIAFDTNSFELIGDAEPLGDFTKSFAGEKTTEGWKNLGGVSNATTPPDSSIQSLLRFKLRAIKDGTSFIYASKSNTPGKETILHGIDAPVPATSTIFPPLQLLTVATIGETAYDYDVNADGLVSPLDSLIVINRINRESVLLASGASITSTSDNSKLDVNQDGIISLLDVLTLVNRINQKTATAVTTTPMMNAQGSPQESTPSLKRKWQFADAFFSYDALNPDEFA